MAEEEVEPKVSEGVVLSNGYRWEVKVNEPIDLTDFDVIATYVVVTSPQAKHFDRKNCIYVRR